MTEQNENLWEKKQQEDQQNDTAAAAAAAGSFFHKVTPNDSELKKSNDDNDDLAPAADSDPFEFNLKKALDLRNKPSLAQQESTIQGVPTKGRYGQMG